MLPIKHLSLVPKAVPSPGGADGNNVIGRSHVSASFTADGDVVATRAKSECSSAKGLVIRTGYIIPECRGADGCVAATVHVVQQSKQANGRVVLGGSVVEESLETYRRVFDAVYIVKEREGSSGRAGSASGVA
jgi:hypothetical protein